MVDVCCYFDILLHVVKFVMVLFSAKLDVRILQLEILNSLITEGPHSSVALVRHWIDYGLDQPLS